MDYTYLNYTSNGQNPISFKDLVLYKAKGLSLFSHLRDYSLSNVTDFTYERWSQRDYGQEYYLKQIEYAEKRIADLQKYLLYFETDETYHQAYLQQLEWDLCGKYESMLKSIQNHSSYSYRHKEELRQRKEKLQYALDKWLQYETDNQGAQALLKALQSSIKEMIDTVDKEINECGSSVDDSALDYRKRIDTYHGLTLEEKESCITNNLLDSIKDWKEKLKSYKRCLKKIEEEDEIIRILFDSLDKNNEEI